MKRFIHHEELARDSRFVRQDNAQSTVLATLPDDVDTIVDAFEQFSDMIEQSVKGTAAEPLFEAGIDRLDELSPSQPFLSSN